MKTYSHELRDRVIAAREKGYSAAEVAERLSISKRSAERYWKQYQQYGHTRPKQRGGYKRSRLEKYDETLKAWIAHQPDLTLEEMRQRCLKQLGITIGINALWQRLNKLDLSYKKNSLRQRTKA